MSAGALGAYTPDVQIGGADPKSSWASSDAVRRTMLGCRSRDTKPELALRSAAHRRGLRFRVNASPIPGMRRTADMVFPGPRVAVFMDGCFWHGCPTHFTPPTINRDYWLAKIAGNIQRDRDTDARLRSEEWEVVRVWEHDDPVQAVGELVLPLVARRKL